MHGPSACMQFLNGGKLKIADNAHFTYGHQGYGILLLKTGSTIEIGKNASLTFDGDLFLRERKSDQEAQQIYMTLRPESHLAFTGNATVTNKYSIDNSIKLNIYMKGGTIDLSELDEHERSLIHLIYDEPFDNPDDNLTVSPNPLEENRLHFQYIVSSEQDANAEIYSTDGRLVSSVPVSLQKGLNDLSLSLPADSKGMFILAVTGADGKATARFYKP